MSDFDEERGLGYFLRLRDAIYQNMLGDGRDEEEARLFATKTAIKLLIRNVGPENAQKVIGLAKKRGIIADDLS